MFEDDFAHELARISAPTLIVWGARDAFCPQADQLALKTAIARSRLTVYPDAGHAVHWDEPSRFAGRPRRVRPFIGGIACAADIRVPPHCILTRKESMSDLASGAVLGNWVSPRRYLSRQTIRPPRTRTSVTERVSGTILPGDAGARVVAVAGSDVTLDERLSSRFPAARKVTAAPSADFRSSRPQAGRRHPVPLPEGHGLRPGDSVALELDWPRRYRLMRLHFAAELVLELVTQALPGIAKIGAHIAEDKARIDFEWHQSVAALLPHITAQATAIIEDCQGANDHDVDLH
jgi:hypothetical protein